MQIKVRDREITSSLLAALAFAALAAGCGGGGAEDQLDVEGMGASGRFGDPYQLVHNFTEADPDLSPMLLGDTLMARLTYPGGCDDHTFELGYEVARDTAKLWLTHDAHGDDCEALLRDELRLPVPAEALQAPIIVLLHPEGDAPYVLRWGR